MKFDELRSFNSVPFHCAFAQVRNYKEVPGSEVGGSRMFGGCHDAFHVSDILPWIRRGNTLGALTPAVDTATWL